MKALFSIILSGLMCFCVPAGAQEHIAREYIEWSDVWLTGANQTDKPHVLLLGNSITRGYHPKVEKLLEGKAYVGAAFRFEECGRPCLARRGGGHTEAQPLRRDSFQQRPARF